MEASDLVEPWLAHLESVRPLLARLLRREECSVGAFVQSFNDDPRPEPLQDPSDYVDLVCREAEALQGPEVAERLCARLKRKLLVNTANHLCLECLPLTVQSMIAAALGEGPDGVLLVEACAGIPMNNLSYPQGLLLARRREGRMLRVPLLDIPSKSRSQIVWGIEGFGSAELDRAMARAEALEGVSIKEKGALEQILKHLTCPQILAESRFDRQVALALPRLWEAWLQPQTRAQLPALVYLPAESIRIPLLRRDLRDPSSLASRALFNPDLRDALLQELDGLPGCWNEGGRSGGSVFFWHVDEERRLSPLVWRDGQLTSSNGKCWPLEAEAIEQGLANGTLLPTLFLNLLVGTVRGLTQVGGFNQIEYQAAMGKALGKVLAHYGSAKEAAIFAIPPSHLLTAGLYGIMAECDGELLPAGGVELAAAGGMDPETLDRFRNLSLREALGPELPRLLRGTPGLEADSSLPPAIHSGFPVIRL